MAKVCPMTSLSVLRECGFQMLNKCFNAFLKDKFISPLFIKLPEQSTSYCTLFQLPWLRRHSESYTDFIVQKNIEIPSTSKSHPIAELIRKSSSIHMPLSGTYLLLMNCPYRKVHLVSQMYISGGELGTQSFHPIR